MFEFIGKIESFSERLRGFKEDVKASLPQVVGSFVAGLFKLTDETLDLVVLLLFPHPIFNGFNQNWIGNRPPKNKRKRFVILEFDRKVKLLRNPTARQEQAQDSPHQ